MPGTASHATSGLFQVQSFDVRARPTPVSMWSTVIVLLLSSLTRSTSFSPVAAVLTATTVVFKWISTPSRASASERIWAASRSSLGRNFGSFCAMTTCDPNRQNACANSHPNGPPPITRRRRGHSVRSNASSLVKYPACSRPGMIVGTGRAPVAISALPKRMVASPTMTASASGEPRRAKVQIDAGKLQSFGRMVLGDPGPQTPHPFHRGGKILLDAAWNRRAELFRAPHIRIEARCPNDRLGGNGSSQQGHAAEQIALDQRHLRAPVDRGLHRGEPCRTGADHEKIIGRRGIGIAPSGRPRIGRIGIEGACHRRSASGGGLTVGDRVQSHPPSNPARRNPVAICGHDRISFQIRPER